MSFNWLDPTGVESTLTNDNNPSLTYKSGGSDSYSSSSSDSTTSEQSLNDQLLQLQLDEANYNEALRPLLLQNMGLVEETDDSGNTTFRDMTEEERYGTYNSDGTITGGVASDEEKTQYFLDKAASEEQKKYALGQGTTPDEITQQLNEMGSVQDSLLRKRLGAKGALLSTPGIDTASKNAAVAQGVKSSYAYGNETQGLGLLSNAATDLYNQNASANNTGGLLSGGYGLPGMGATSQTSTVAQNNLYSLQDSLGQQKQNAVGSGILQGAGSVAGMYLTKGMGGK